MYSTKVETATVYYYTDFVIIDCWLKVTVQIYSTPLLSDIRENKTRDMVVKLVA